MGIIVEKRSEPLLGRIIDAIQFKTFSCGNSNKQ